jgi:hypothetical protein
MITKERAMYTTGQSIHPVHSIFGAGYLAENHADDEHLKLPPIAGETQFADFVRSLRMLVGAEPPVTKR